MMKTLPLLAIDECLKMRYTIVYPFHCHFSGDDTYNPLELRNPIFSDTNPDLAGKKIGHPWSFPYNPWWFPKLWPGPMLGSIERSQAFFGPSSGRACQRPCICRSLFGSKCMVEVHFWILGCHTIPNSFSWRWINGLEWFYAFVEGRNLQRPPVLGVTSASLRRWFFERVPWTKSGAILDMSKQGKSCWEFRGSVCSFSPLPKRTLVETETPVGSMRMQRVFFTQK